MLHALFVTLAAVTVSSPARSPAPVASGSATRHLAALSVVRPEELYSLRARRRFAAYLRLRLLELRSEGLERAADVIERKMSVDRLMDRLVPK